MQTVKNESLGAGEVGVSGRNRHLHHAFNNGWSSLIEAAGCDGRLVAPGKSAIVDSYGSGSPMGRTEQPAVPAKGRLRR